MKRIVEFFSGNKLAGRVLRHLLFWSALYWLLIKSIAPRIFDDNSQVTDAASFLTLMQTVTLHYFIAYYVLPRFLYRRRYVALTLALIACFFVAYAFNYLQFTYLNTVTNGVNSGGGVSYARKIFLMLQEAGWLGCFTHLRVFVFNLAYNFFLVILSVSFKGINDTVIYQRRLVVAERDKYALELEFLKAQVNPHFLFNTLNSIYARIFDTDEQAADLVLRLSELMRYNLYETDLASIALDKELAYIQNYLALERNRLADQHVLIDYEQTGTPEHYQIAPLLLISFVENAFKHGAKGATEPAHIHVNATVLGGQLHFVVENSVPSRRQSVSSGKKSGGIGLVNVRKRLDALYPNRYTLTVTPSENNYQVILVIQLDEVAVQ